MKNKFSAVLLLLLLSLNSFAQKQNFPPFSGFKLITDYPLYTAENLWDFIDGAADTYLSYGFVDLNIAEYKKGKDIIKVEIYRHSSHLMAFGIYSSERSPSFRFVNLGVQGYIIDGAVNFFKGKYYVKIRTFSKKEKVLKNLESLAVRIADMLEGDTEMPKLLSLLPTTGKIANSESYISESILGHKFLNNACKADYEFGKNKRFSVYVISHDITEDAVKTVKNYFEEAGKEFPELESGKYVMEDGYNGSVFLSWKGTLVVIISGLDKYQTEIAEIYTYSILK